MEVSRFVLEGDTQHRAMHNFKCKICAKIVIDPHTCSQSHPFCKTCILKHIDSESTCPVDNAHLTVDGVKPSTFIDEMLAMFKIRCDNRRTPHRIISKHTHRRSICHWQGSMSELKAHQLVCPFRKEPCHDCGRDVLSMFALAHRVRCPSRSVSCELCYKSVPSASLSTHLKVCPMAAVYCPNHCVVQSTLGNALVLRRKNLDAHLPICPNRMDTCEFAHVGCPFWGTSSQLESHMRTAVHAHLSAMAKSHSKIVSALRSLGADIPELSAPSPLSHLRPPPSSIAPPPCSTPPLPCSTPPPPSPTPLPPSPTPRPSSTHPLPRSAHPPPSSAPHSPSRALTNPEETLKLRKRSSHPCIGSTDTNNGPPKRPRKSLQSELAQNTRTRDSHGEHPDHSDSDRQVSADPELHPGKSRSSHKKSKPIRRRHPKIEPVI